MLDFTPVRNKEISYADLCRNLSVDDLRDLTDSMIDRQLDLIAGCTDADVVFEPADPAAKDDAAATEGEVHMPWTLGHVMVHVTASSEEAAFLAAEMARGVDYEPRRSRSEVHWTTVTTIDQCRDRLEESRRMRHASLDLWPSEPYLDNTYVSPHSGIEIDPVMRFVFGLSHDDAHLAQLEDIIEQAQAARG
ncbi:MAG TPA: DinB family protein [Anaerolineales bacterium]|nr:DinB family protein [Anaerolineales bacterium]